MSFSSDSFSDADSAHEYVWLQLLHKTLISIVYRAFNFFFFSHQPQSPVCLTRVCIIRLFSLMNLQKCIFHSDQFIIFFLILFYLFFREDNTDDRLWVLIFCCCFIKWGCYLIFLSFFSFPTSYNRQFAEHGYAPFDFSVLWWMYKSVFFIQIILFSFFLCYFIYFFKGRQHKRQTVSSYFFVVVLLGGGAIWFSFNFIFLSPPVSTAGKTLRVLMPMNMSMYLIRSLFDCLSLIRGSLHWTQQIKGKLYFYSSAYFHHLNS